MTGSSLNLGLRQRHRIPQSWERARLPEGALCTGPTKDAHLSARQGKITRGHARQEKNGKRDAPASSCIPVIPELVLPAISVLWRDKHGRLRGTMICIDQRTRLSRGQRVAACQALPHMQTIIYLYLTTYAVLCLRTVMYSVSSWTPLSAVLAKTRLALQHHAKPVAYGNCTLRPTRVRASVVLHKSFPTIVQLYLRSPARHPVFITSSCSARPRRHHPGCCRTSYSVVAPQLALAFSLASLFPLHRSCLLSRSFPLARQLPLYPSHTLSPIRPDSWDLPTPFCALVFVPVPLICSCRWLLPLAPAPVTAPVTHPFLPCIWPVGSGCVCVCAPVLNSHL